MIARSAPALGACSADSLTHGEARAPAASNGAAAPEHALSGVTIVEFGFFYAMPFGVALAASLGARVIKLEGGDGDPMRHAFGGDAGSAKVMEGKESLSIDMKSPEGRDIVHQLIARADVFVLGFRPGVAERLGIDYETLSKINPKLVYVHAAGYGAQGPYSHRPVYASTALALAGNLARHAGFWMNPDLSADFSVVELQNVIAPRLRGPVDGDSNAAQTACSALMFGLFHQRRTGVGQFLSTSMIGGNVYSYSDDAVTYDGKPPVPVSDPEQYGLNALYRLYKTGDGWIFLAATNDKERAALEHDARASQLPDGDDARIAVLAEAFADRKADEIEHELTRGRRRLRHGLPRRPSHVHRHRRRDARDGARRRHRAPALRHHPPPRPPGGALRDAGPHRPGLPPGPAHRSDPRRSWATRPEQIAELEAKKVVFGPD